MADLELAAANAGLNPQQFCCLRHTLHAKARSKHQQPELSEDDGFSAIKRSVDGVQHADWDKLSCRWDKLRLSLHCPQALPECTPCQPWPTVQTQTLPIKVEASIKTGSCELYPCILVSSGCVGFVGCCMWPTAQQTHPQLARMASVSYSPLYPEQCQAVIARVYPWG